MTVFNAEAYLASSIESIQRQTCTDWEFIIVDDASTDASLAIAESHAGKDIRIKVIRNALNKGQTRCLNQGMAKARGILIARQDADDLSHPERLEKQWQRFQQEAALALLGTCGGMINQEKKLVGILDKPLSHEVITWSAPMMNPFLHTSVMFRADVVRSLGGYDEHYEIAQDYDLWTRIMRYHRVANLAQRLISYRHLDSSLSKSGKNKAFHEAHKIAVREERKSFGRELQPHERSLIQSFREGECENQYKLLQLYKILQYSLPSHVHADLRRLEAIYHLQGAGGKNQNWHHQLRGLLAAFSAAPCYTLDWLRNRFLKQGVAI